MNASTASNAAAAVVAALREQGNASAIPMNSHRRSLGSKKGLESTSIGGTSSIGTYFNRPSSAVVSGHVLDGKPSQDGIDDDAVDETTPADKVPSGKSRNRRASEGSYLVKGEGKRSISELRCDTCGKSYKHSSCLTKHMYVSLKIHPMTVS